MRYRVIYRLTHPEYLPTTSTKVIDAFTHREMIDRLAKIKARWATQGYSVRIIKVMGRDVKKEQGAGQAENVVSNDITQ